jgi:hypothetical protein
MPVTRSLSRREFLFLPALGGDRTAVLSCERLYMQYVDTQLSVPTPPLVDGLDQEVLSTLTADELFDQLEQRLQSAAAVRVVDGGWLSPGDFRGRLESILARFEARGGRVTVDAAPAPTGPPSKT